MKMFFRQNLWYYRLLIFYFKIFQCGKEQNVDAVAIKECAKGEKGTQLLKYYGDESSDGHYSYVPYLRINGEHRARFNFVYKVCKTFKVPPPPCVEVINSENDEE